jgi:hypothetical protein
MIVSYVMMRGKDKFLPCLIIDLVKVYTEAD